MPTDNNPKYIILASIVIENKKAKTDTSLETDGHIQSISIDNDNNVMTTKKI